MTIFFRTMKLFIGLFLVSLGGVFVDFIKSLNIVTMNDNFIIGFFMMNLGMIIMAIGTVMYISCELGCGAKDSVTMGLTKLLNRPVKVTRSILELIAIVVGIILGGSFGILTIYGAFVLGYFMQTTFKILGCNIGELKHISIKDMLHMRMHKKEQDVDYDVDYEEVV